MKRFILLLPLTAFLLLMFPITAFADVIEGPPLLDVGASLVPPAIITILVAALAVGTIFIIRRLKEPSRGNGPSRSGGGTGRSAHDMQNPPKR